jgi:hypothetical protein
MKVFYLIILITANQSFQRRIFKVPSAFLIRSPTTTIQATKLFVNVRQFSNPSRPTSNPTFIQSSQVKRDRDIITSNDDKKPSRIIYSSTSSNYIDLKDSTLFILISALALVVILFILFLLCLCNSKIRNNIQKSFIRKSSELQLAELNRQLREEEQNSGIDNEIFSIDTHNPLARTASHLTVVDFEN